ncbi:MAG TPA: hypothetical protein VN903_00525 [Polyangia bacterium]|jgi:hypothetical protein|nr:hypothetical protein [Polyangia bacterium]
MPDDLEADFAALGDAASVREETTRIATPEARARLRDRSARETDAEVRGVIASGLAAR